MAMEITNTYGSYAAGSAGKGGAAGRTGKPGNERAAERANAGGIRKTAGYGLADRTGSAQNGKASGEGARVPGAGGSVRELAKGGRTQSTAEYARELAKLVPSVDFRVGCSFANDKTGKTLTVNPKLLEKMQNDPEQEKETKELIRGVESMTRLMKSIYEGSGWTVVFKHSYIDENGKYRSVALVRNDFGYKMSEKLREERKKNTEKFMERSKEKAVRKKEDIQQKLDEKSEEKVKARDKATKLFEEKLKRSKDGMIYLCDTDLRTVLEDEKEEQDGKGGAKGQTPAGAKVDLKI